MPDPRPNILVVLTDQQRHDTIAAHLDRFGCTTPTLDGLAQRGVVFAEHCCNNPICCPSRATLMTGLHPSRAGVPNNSSPPLSEELPTVARRLRAAGYETAYHGKSHLKGDLRWYGFETAYENSHDPSTLNEAARFWRNRDWAIHSRPFYHVVSFLDPHDIYFLDPDHADAPAEAPWGNLAASDDDRPIVRRYLAARPSWSAGRWAYYRRFYRERVERVDRHVGGLLDELTWSGFAPNTWVIFSSDHGDLGGEHGRPFKGLSLFDASVRVPLVIRPPQPRMGGRNTVPLPWSGGFSPRVSHAQSSHVDLVPTILDLAGAPADPGLPGRSLVLELRGETLPDPAGVFLESTDNKDPARAVRAVRTRQWKYLLAAGGEEELYELATDPWETRNRCADAGPVRDRLRGLLLDHLQREADPFLGRLPT